MPDIAFGPGFYEREVVGAPPRELRNLFAEAAPNMPDRQFILQRTPGLAAYKDLSGTLTRGLGTSVDQFNNDLFVVYDDQFKRITTGDAVSANIPVTATSAVIASDSNPVSMAFSAIQEMAFTSAGTAYVYNGTTLVDVLATGGTIGDLNYVNVVYLSGRFVFIPNDDDQFWWSEVLDGDNVDALNFATAERKGSNLRAGTEFRGDLWLFEKDNIEIWQPTGRVDLPFQLRPGGVIDKGIIGPWAHTRVGQSLFWMGDDRVVYRAEGQNAVPVSTPAISEHLQGIAESNREKVTAFSYIEDGHQFVVFNVGDPGTENAAWVFDTSTNEWHERVSNQSIVNTGFIGYAPWAYSWWNGNHYIGARYDAVLYSFNSSVYGEQSADGLTTYEVSQVATTFVPSRQYLPCYNFTIDCTKGTSGTKTITGATQANPVVITSAAHGFSNGDVVRITGVVGMTELNGREFTVANAATNTFELSGEDGSAYTAYSSAGAASLKAEIFLSWSDDLGNSYTSERSLSMGASAQYSVRATTAQLGRIIPPGRVFKIRFTDKTELAIFGARMNEENP